jgi:hypothetical protein
MLRSGYFFVKNLGLVTFAILPNLVSSRQRTYHYINKQMSVRDEGKEMI